MRRFLEAMSVVVKIATNTAVSWLHCVPVRKRLVQSYTVRKYLLGRGLTKRRKCLTAHEQKVPISLTLGRAFSARSTAPRWPTNGWLLFYFYLLRSSASRRIDRGRVRLRLRRLTKPFTRRLLWNHDGNERLSTRTATQTPVFYRSNRRFSLQQGKTGRFTSHFSRRI